MAQSLYWKGDLEGALKLLQAAATATQALVANYPDNKDYAQDLIEIYRFYGDSLRNQGNIEQAIGQYQNWLNLANRLAAKQPDELTWLRDQLFAHQRMGDVLLAKNKPADARPQFRLISTSPRKRRPRKGTIRNLLKPSKSPTSVSAIPISTKVTWTVAEGIQIYLRLRLNWRPTTNPTSSGIRIWRLLISASARCTCASSSTTWR